MEKVVLPSLSTVRVFEAAARRLSFTKAADELGMTQAAVSYQIKALEDRLGAPVFRRTGRAVVLTRAGERLAQASSEAMAILRDAFADLNQGDGVLAISALPTLAVTWLVPRLGAFQLANPHLAVRLDTTNRIIDLAHEDFDVGIRWGSGDWPGMEAKAIFPSLYTPLASPELLSRFAPLARPEQLHGLPLIGDPKDWRAWFTAAGVDSAEDEIRPRAGYEVQQYDVAAALGGQGVALASPVFFANEIASGRLVRPFETVWRETYPYWLAYPFSRRLNPKIVTFRDWLLKAVAEDPVIAREVANAQGSGAAAA